MGLAASGLALIAKRSAEYREIVREQLVKKLASKTEAVRQRASEALREIAEDDSDTKGGSKKAAARAGSGRPLVSLLKEGLKDGRVEAQEYALRSLSSITDAASKADIIEAGVIPLLMKALTSGQLSAVHGPPHRYSNRARCHLFIRIMHAVTLLLGGRKKAHSAPCPDDLLARWLSCYT